MAGGRQEFEFVSEMTAVARGAGAAVTPPTSRPGVRAYSFAVAPTLSRPLALCRWKDVASLETWVGGFHETKRAKA